MTWKRLDLFKLLKHFTPHPLTHTHIGTVPIWMPFTQVFTLYFCTRAHSMPCALFFFDVWSGYHSAPLKSLSFINICFSSRRPRRSSLTVHHWAANLFVRRQTFSDSWCQWWYRRWVLDNLSRKFNIEGKGVQYCIYISNVFMLALTG